MATLLPSWVDSGLLDSVVAGRGAGSCLDDTVPGYALYRYIGDNNLSSVRQLFDAEAQVSAALFNDGRDGGWLIRPGPVPGSNNASTAATEPHGAR